MRVAVKPSSPVVHPRITPEDFRGMLLEHGEELPIELIDGEAVVVVTGESIGHRRVTRELERALEAWCLAQSPTWTLHGNLREDIEGSNFAPDLAVWRPERHPPDDGQRLLPGAPVPDLAVEVLSPSTRSNDLGPKRRVLLEHGVREVWLVDPDELTVLIDDGQRERQLGPADTLTSSLLPGFAVAVADLRPPRP